MIRKPLNCLECPHLRIGLGNAQVAGHRALYCRVRIVGKQLHMFRMPIYA